MLKVTRKGITLIIPNHWLNNGGFLKHKAVYAIKLFFGDVSLEKALEESHRNILYCWIGQFKRRGEEKD